MNHEEPKTVGDTPGPRRLPLWVVAAAFLALAGFLALIAWGLRRAQQGPIVIGQEVPAFSVTTFDGESYHTAEMRGKVIVLNFWASWCTPCEAEAAELEQAWQLYRERGDVVFLGVDYVDTEPEARAYLEKFAISYPNGPDLRTTISQLFRIRGVPETYIIDREGRLAYQKIGPFTSLAEIQAAVESVLN